MGKISNIIYIYIFCIELSPGESRTKHEDNEGSEFGGGDKEVGVLFVLAVGWSRFKHPTRSGSHTATSPHHHIGRKRRLEQGTNTNAGRGQGNK